MRTIEWPLALLAVLVAPLALWGEGVSTRDEPADEAEGLLFLHGRLKPGGEEAYAAYLAGTRPLLEVYGGVVTAVGEGVAGDHAADAWPINGLIVFPDVASVEGFLADPRYRTLRETHRDAAYEELHLTVVRGRRPRIRGPEDVARDAFEDFRAGLATGAWQPFLDRLSDDFTFRFPVGRWQGTHEGKEAAAAFFAFVSEAYPEGLTVTEVERVTAQGDRVVFEFRDEGLLRGQPYANLVAVSLDVCGERICGYREYFGLVGPPPSPEDRP